MEVIVVESAMVVLRHQFRVSWRRNERRRKRERE
jgi:hypothetical protein